MNLSQCEIRERQGYEAGGFQIETKFALQLPPYKKNNSFFIYRAGKGDFKERKNDEIEMKIKRINK